MENEILDIAKESIFILIKVATPILLVALVVGLAISLLQALTQIQEATLSFVPKILAIAFALLLFMPYMSGQLRYLAERIFERIAG